MLKVQTKYILKGCHKLRQENIFVAKDHTERKVFRTENSQKTDAEEMKLTATIIGHKLESNENQRPSKN